VRVALFVTCLVGGVVPEVGKATVALLRRLIGKWKATARV